jgi:hypothetical protein
MLRGESGADATVSLAARCPQCLNSLQRGRLLLDVIDIHSRKGLAVIPPGLSHTAAGRRAPYATAASTGAAAVVAAAGSMAGFSASPATKAILKATDPIARGLIGKSMKAAKYAPELVNTVPQIVYFFRGDRVEVNKLLKPKKYISKKRNIGYGWVDCFEFEEMEE